MASTPIACRFKVSASLQPEDVSILGQLAVDAGTLGEQIEHSDQQGKLFAPTELSKGSVPEAKAIQFWFEPFVIEELAQIGSWTDTLRTSAARTLARVALSSIIVAVSRQDSDTRYVRRQKNIRPGDVLKRFSRALGDALRAAMELTELLEPRFSRRVVHTSVLDANECGDGYAYAGTDFQRLEHTMKGYGLIWPGRD